MKNFLAIIFFLITGYCVAQKPNLTSKDFTEKFQADSLGTTGFRLKMAIWDSTKKTVVINKVSVLGWEKKNVLAFLGNPSSTLVDTNGTTFSYTIYQENIHANGWMILRIDIRIVNDKVIFVYEAGSE